MAEEKKRECPCCRSKRVGRFVGDEDERATGITCCDCGLRTLPYREPSKALAVWNRREPRRRTVIDASQGGTP